MSDATDIVTTFLADLSRRDLAAASSKLAPDFEMHVAGQVFKTLQDFAAFSKGRQKETRKHLDHCDVCKGPNGTDIVYARGTMAGVWNDGVTFDGIYWVDRFEVKDGQVVKFQVASDMAEFRPVTV